MHADLKSSDSDSPAKPLAQYGYIAQFVSDCFLALEYATILQRLFRLKPRGEHHKDLERAGSPAMRLILVKQNARRSDHYIVACLTVELLALGSAALLPGLFGMKWFACIVASLCFYRIVDIFQNISNRLIFGALRGRGQNRMASGVRTLILTVIAYFEAEVCFALLYFVWRSDLMPAKFLSIGDCLYFSGITQLTIGYGDISPVHGLRCLALLQAGLGFFFTVILVARLIGELPQITGDLERVP